MRICDDCAGRNRVHCPAAAYRPGLSPRPAGFAPGNSGGKPVGGAVGGGKPRGACRAGGERWICPGRDPSGGCTGVVAPVTSPWGQAWHAHAHPRGETRYGNAHPRGESLPGNARPPAPSPVSARLRAGYAADYRPGHCHRFWDAGAASGARFTR